MINVFIIGSKGIPANYGGYETFVDRLTKYKVDLGIHYYVACQNRNKDEFYNNAYCFDIEVANIGPAKAILYDLKSFIRSLKYIKRNDLKNCIIYVLTCRIGPFYKFLISKAHKLGCKVYLNPDGHEWKRSKWPYLVKKYWKYSEKVMIKYSDLIICDSVNIQKYVDDVYKAYKKNTVFIPYGADLSLKITEQKLLEYSNFLNKFNIKANEYYLVVGRFVPENNLSTILKEFHASNTRKKLLIITNVENNKFYKKLLSNFDFRKDKRIIFAGTVYNSEVLFLLRYHAYGYIHGHSVGGTNPSLLEALATTNLNLLFDVSFNREVGRNSCFYWNCNSGSLKDLLESCDSMQKNNIIAMGNEAKNIIKKYYSREYIVGKYEEIFK